MKQHRNLIYNSYEIGFTPVILLKHLLRLELVLLSIANINHKSIASLEIEILPQIFNHSNFEVPSIYKILINYIKRLENIFFPPKLFLIVKCELVT